MAENTYYSILLKLFQALTYFPISYNKKDSIFEKSRLILLYTLTCLLLIGAFLHYMIYDWCYNYALRILGSDIEEFYIILLWLSDIIPWYILLNQLLFKRDTLVDLANEILECHRIFNWNYNCLHKQFVQQCVIEFILQPILTIAYIAYLGDFDPSTRAISSYLGWILLALNVSFIFLFSLAMQYYITFISFLNFQLHNISNDIMIINTRENVDEMENFLLALTKVQNIIPKITEIFAPIILFIFLNMANNLTWGYYFVITFTTMPTLPTFTQNLNMGILSYIEATVTTMYFFKYFMYVIKPSDILKNTISETKLLLFEIKNKIDTENKFQFNKKVSGMLFFCIYFISIELKQITEI